MRTYRFPGHKTALWVMRRTILLTIPLYWMQREQCAERKTAYARGLGEDFERSHHRQHQGSRTSPRSATACSYINAAGRMGAACVPFFRWSSKPPRSCSVLPRAIARVLVQLLRQCPGIVLLPGPHAHIHRTAGHHALPFWDGATIAAIYLDAWALPLVVSGGALLGLGRPALTCCGNACSPARIPTPATATSIKGTLYAAVLYSRCTYSASGDGVSSRSCSCRYSG